MADSYIDPFETVTYGRLAREQMRARVLPLHADWAPAVNRAIALQQERDDRMAELLAHLSSPSIDQAVIDEAGDTIIRFNSWLMSLKGRPLDPAIFFGTAVPSDIARSRLSKLAGRLEQMVASLTPYATGGPGGGETVEGAASRLAELTEARDAVVRMRDVQRDAAVDRKTYTPQIEAARAAWLATYVANKRLIEGILRHEGQLALLPVIFDDLAEIQRDAPAEHLASLTTGGTPTGGDAPPADPSAGNG